MCLFPSFRSMNHFCWINCSYIRQRFLRKQTAEIQMLERLHGFCMRVSSLIPCLLRRQTRPGRDPGETVAAFFLSIHQRNWWSIYSYLLHLRVQMAFHKCACFFPRCVFYFCRYITLLAGQSTGKHLSHTTTTKPTLWLSQLHLCGN